jgi:hypothetical protein
VTLELRGVGPEDARRRALAAFATRHLARASGGEGGRRIDLDAMVARDGSDAAFVEDLGRALAFAFADQIADRAVFHAGLLLAAGGGAILLPGASGAGKSTLVARAVAAGFALATDELTVVDPRPRTAPDRVLVDGLARPIHLKPPSVALLHRFAEGGGSEWVTGSSGAFVHAAGLGGSTASGPAPLGAVVFPRFDPAGDDALVRRAPAAAARSLMEVLVNARALAGHGFPDVARLVRAVPAYDLVYGSVDAAARSLRHACAKVIATDAANTLVT